MSPRHPMPRYPAIRVRLRTEHPLAMVSAVRHALRRSGVENAEIRRFSAEALATPTEARDVCSAWARIEHGT